MSELLRHRTSAVWAVLVAATGLSWVLGSSHGTEGGSVTAATAVVLAIAFLKARYVGLDFMELRHADRRLRLAFEAWILVVGATVIGCYLAG